MILCLPVMLIYPARGQDAQMDHAQMEMTTSDRRLDSDNPGKWMAHCHIAEHIHAGMLMMFEVVGELDPQ